MIGRCDGETHTAATAELGGLLAERGDVVGGGLRAQQRVVDAWRRGWLDPGVVHRCHHARMDVTVVDHPLAGQLLTRLRDEATDRAGFRRAMDDLSGILVYEATRDLEVEAIEVRTPLATTTGHPGRARRRSSSPCCGPGSGCSAACSATSRRPTPASSASPATRTPSCPSPT